jgi:hypothetical protein
MTSLANQAINTSFGGLLQIPGGLTTSYVALQDGNGNALPMSAASAGITLTMTGGTINNVAIGSTTQAAGKFTTLSSSGNTSFSGANSSISIQPTGTGVVYINPAVTGAMDNMVIGGTTPVVGHFSSSTGTPLYATSTGGGDTIISYAGTNSIILTGVGRSSDNSSRIRFLNNAFSAELSAILENGSSNLTFITAGSERMRIDSSGNVGIGTSSPKSLLNVVNGTVSIQNGTGGLPGSGYGWEIYNVNTTTNYLQSYNRTSSAYMNSVYNALLHQFFVSGSEAARIDSSGNLLVGTTTAYTSGLNVTTNGNTGVGYFRNSATSGITADQLQVLVAQAAGTGYYLARFYTSSGSTQAFSVRGDGLIYSAYLTGGATTLSVDASGNIIRTPSDRLLKINDETIPYGLSDVEKMRPIIHEWTAESGMGDGKSIGFIAQEMEEIIPEVVSGNESKSLDYPKLTVVLVKAIQELSAKVAELEAKLN